MDLIGSDLRSSAALIIAGIIAEGTSKIYGLEHLDRGYENFESKLKTLGIKITREFNKNTFTENEFKAGKDSEETEKFSCLLYTSPSPRDRTRSRMPSSA